jgi:hypothetical protein
MTNRPKPNKEIGPGIWAGPFVLSEAWPCAGVLLYVNLVDQNDAPHRSEETWAAANHQRLLSSVIFFLRSIDPVTDGSSTRPHHRNPNRRPDFPLSPPSAARTLRPPHPQP